MALSLSPFFVEMPVFQKYSGNKQTLLLYIFTNFAHII